MKGDKKILVIAILLLVISAGFTTYAIYKSTTTATGTVNLAAWHVEVDSNDFTNSPATVNLTLDLSNAVCTVHNGKAGTLAPGDTCTITVPVDATGSQVDVLLEASLGTVTGKPSNMTVALASGSDSQVINYAASDMTADVVIEIEWVTADTSSNNSADLASQGGTLSIPLTLTASQNAYS